METCNHLWVQISTANDKEKPRRCQCLSGCRKITKFSDEEFLLLKSQGKVKLEVSFPGIGTW